MGRRRVMDHSDLRRHAESLPDVAEMTQEQAWIWAEASLPEVVLGLLDELDHLRSHTILWRGSICPCDDDDCPIEAQ